MKTHTHTHTHTCTNMHTHPLFQAYYPLCSLRAYVQVHLLDKSKELGHPPEH